MALTHIAGNVFAMTVPLDEGEARRRRIGPFWIEEGLGLVAVGGAILAVFAVLFILAVIFRPM
jgi:hypothetical protein